MSATQPSSVGTSALGKWTLAAGAGVFDNGSVYNTTVTGLGFGTNTLNWAITYKGCVFDSSVVITNRSVVADAGDDVTAYVGETVSFEGTANGDASIVKYEWDFDGDGVYDWSSSVSGLTTYTYSTAGTYTAVLRVTDDDGLTDTDSRVVEVKDAVIELYIRNLDDDKLHVSIYVDDLNNVWGEVDVSAAEHTKFLDKIDIPVDPGSHYVLINYTDPDLGGNTDSATVEVNNGEHKQLYLYTIRDKPCWYYEHYAEKLPDEDKIKHSFIFNPENVSKLAEDKLFADIVADAIIDDIDKVQGRFYYTDLGIFLGQVIAKSKISDDLYTSASDLNKADGTYQYGTYQLEVSTSQTLKVVIQGLDLIGKVWRSLTTPELDEILGNLKNIACTVDFIGDKVEEWHYDDSVTVDVTKIATQGMVKLLVKSGSSAGRSIIVNLDNGILSFMSEDAVVVKVDGDVIGRAEDYADVIDPTDENVPEFFVNHIDEDSTQIIISFPSFSDHDVTITTDSSYSGSSPSENSSKGDSTPGFEFILIIVAIAFVLLLKQQRLST